MIRMTHTSCMNLEKREKSHVDMTFVTKHEAYKTYFLSEEALEMLEQTDFLDNGLQDI